MVTLELAKEKRAEAIASLKKYFEEEIGEPLGDLRAGLLLNEPGLDIASEASTPVTVVDLPSPGRGTEFMLGLKNFYVLTRYNRSFFYALAVYQLGERVKAQMEASNAASASSNAAAPDAASQ